MSAYLTKIEPFVTHGKKNNQTKLILSGDTPARYSTDKQENPINNLMFSNQELGALLKEIAPDSIPAIQRGEQISGMLPFPNLGEISYDAIYREKIISLTIHIEQKDSQPLQAREQTKDEPVAVSPPSGSSQSPTPAYNPVSSAKLPMKLFDNRDNFSLIISANQEVIKQASTYYQHLNTYNHIVASKEELDVILDRLVPSNIVFDDKCPDFDFVYKRLYDLKTEIRQTIYITLVSASHKSDDSMAAFVNSVNMIVNIQDLAEFSSLAVVGHKKLEEVYNQILSLK